MNVKRVDIDNCYDAIIKFQNKFKAIPFEEATNEKIAALINDFLSKLNRRLALCEQGLEEKNIQVDHEDLKDIKSALNYYSGFAKVSDESVNEVFERIKKLECLIDRSSP